MWLYHKLNIRMFHSDTETFEDEKRLMQSMYWLLLFYCDRNEGCFMNSTTFLWVSALQYDINSSTQVEEY